MARGRSKADRLAQARQAGERPSGRTRLLGALAGSAVLAVFSAEIARVWRLGTLPRGREESQTLARSHGKVSEAVLVLREGYSVSRTREDPVFNMLFGFIVSFAAARVITSTLREREGVGPLRNVTVGERHIHHFIPGGLIALGTGAAGIGLKDFSYDNWLARWFGAGVALVLDESALLLELDDVYWTEEGVLSVQIAFASMAALAALTYLIRIVRHSDSANIESDWQTAARAWDDLQFGSGDPEAFGIGG